MFLATLVKIAASLCLLVELYSRYKARRLPPGIVGLRFLWHAPRKHAWVSLLKINKKYGDIASASAFGKHIVVINSPPIAHELLEKHGSKHAHRPYSIMGGELSGWRKTMMLSNYTNEFRDQRKWFAQEIGNNAAVANYHEMMEFETRRTLRLMLERPEGFESHIRKNFTSIMLQISHGYITQDGELENDPIASLGALALTQFTESTSVGRHLVDVFHILKYIPSWFPGAGFKKKAKRYAAVTQETLELPHKYALSQMAAGTALPSLSTRLLSDVSNLTKEKEETIKWATSSMFRGGLDPATASCHAFFLAMVLYPDVMKKAQQEIDSVVGHGRLPTFGDRSSLPYFEFVFAELLRWQAAGGLSVRRAAEDDEYNGYLIPKDTVVITNIWGILRDERLYKDPSRFNPDRYIGEDAEPLPYNVCFGFGRRRCPGYFLAQASCWLICLQSLAVFRISKHVENGVEITPEFKQIGMTVIHQAPFKCSIKPRSAEAEQLIREQFST